MPYTEELSFVIYHGLRLINLQHFENPAYQSDSSIILGRGNQQENKPWEAPICDQVLGQTELSTFSAEARAVALQSSSAWATD